MLNQKNNVMKRLSFFVMAAVIAAGSMFVSCSSDEVEDPTVEVKATYGSKNNESINPVGGVVEDEIGTIVTFKITFTMGSEKLSEVHIKSTIENKTFNVLDSVGLADGIFNLKGGKAIEFTYVTNVGKMQELLSFQTIDKKKNEANFSLTIKALEPEPEEGEEDDEYDYFISASTSFGAQRNATYDSFYSLSNGKQMNIATARANQGLVDFAFFYDTDEKAGVGCPKDDLAGNISYGTTKINTFSPRNEIFFVQREYNSNFPPSDGWWTEFTPLLETEEASYNVNNLKKDDLVFFKKGTTIGAFIVERVPTSNTDYFTVKFVSREKK